MSQVSCVAHMCVSVSVGQVGRWLCICLEFLGVAEMMTPLQTVQTPWRQHSWLKSCLFITVITDLPNLPSHHNTVIVTLYINIIKNKNWYDEETIKSL